MKSRRAIPVALLLTAACALFAKARAAEPDRVRVTHACVVSTDGRPRALEPEALAPRARPALADTNQLRVAFDSPSDPWTATELNHLQGYVADLLPVLEDVCGPPSGSDLIDVIKDRSLYDQGLAGTYSPSDHTIRLYQDDPATLCHELAHAFHGDDVIYWDAFEEGMAVAAAAQVLERLPQYPHAGQFGGADDAAYDILNQPSISAHNGYFWSGMPAVLVRYDLAGYVWRKVAIEHPGFLREFNRSYYERLAASDTLRSSIGALVALAGELAPEMEGMPFGVWADRQYVLGTTSQLGVQIYQFGYSPVVSVFFRHADGYEEPLPGETIQWKATDGDGLSAGSGTVYSEFGGVGFVFPDVPVLSRGSLRVDTSTSTSYGSQTSSITRPLLGGNGLYGVVRGAQDGSLTITPIDKPEPAETVPVRWGAFDAPSFRSWAGRLELAYTDADGRQTTRIVTKDSSSYLAVMDAPAGPLRTPHAALSARPSIAVHGCRLTLNQPLAAPGYLTLYEANGRILRVLAMPAGARAVDWDGVGTNGLFASGGVYIARLVAPGVDARTRIVVTH